MKKRVLFGLFSIMSFTSCSNGDGIKDSVMFIPGFSRLACLNEEYKNPEKNIFNCTFHHFDIERSLDIIDNALKNFDPNSLNVVIFIWSFGIEPDKILMEKWLSEIDYYVKTHKVIWRNIDEIYSEYISD